MFVPVRFCLVLLALLASEGLRVEGRHLPAGPTAPGAGAPSTAVPSGLPGAPLPADGQTSLLFWVLVILIVLGVLAWLFSRSRAKAEPRGGLTA